MPIDMSDRLLLTPSEAAGLLGVSRSKVYELIATRQIPTVQVGHRQRVVFDELRTWVRSRLEDSETLPEQKGRRTDA